MQRFKLRPQGLEGSGLRRVPFGHRMPEPPATYGDFTKLGVPTIMENRMEKKMENEMETGFM